MKDKPEQTPLDIIGSLNQSIFVKHFTAIHGTKTKEEFDKKVGGTGLTPSQRLTMAGIYKDLRDAGWYPVGFDSTGKIQWSWKKVEEVDLSTKLINIRGGYASYCVKVSESYNKGEMTREVYDYLTKRDHYDRVKEKDPTSPLIEPIDGLTIEMLMARSLVNIEEHERLKNLKSEKGRYEEGKKKAKELLLCKLA